MWAQHQHCLDIWFFFFKAGIVSFFIVLTNWHPLLWIYPIFVFIWLLYVQVETEKSRGNRPRTNRLSCCTDTQDWKKFFPEDPSCYRGSLPRPCERDVRPSTLTAFPSLNQMLLVSGITTDLYISLVQGYHIKKCIFDIWVHVVCLNPVFRRQI